MAEKNNNQGFKNVLKHNTCKMGLGEQVFTNKLYPVTVELQLLCLEIVIPSPWNNKLKKKKKPQNPKPKTSGRTLEKCPPYLQVGSLEEYSWLKIKSTFCFTIKVS